MGGELRVQSQVGEGSRFWFDIELEVAEQASLRSACNALDANLRLLIADDNAVAGELLLRTAHSLGWQAELAINDHLKPFLRATIDREFGDAPTQAYAQMTSLPGTMPYAVPAPKFDDEYVTLTYGVRSQLWGLDVLSGSSVTVGHVGGSNLSTYLSVGKRF